MSQRSLEDYAGPFDPERGLASFSRQLLADLGREYLLHGHLQDRVGLPIVTIRYGNEATTEISIEEWMAASPIYSKRVQRALGFEGDDVGTVFKNLQLDIGAPHQFMDFQFRLDRPDYGEFWLPHCGALMDVERFGPDRVRTMCHDIEDPTFDATAAATNPRMKMRPIHRPPREPAGRYPHCRWTVFLDSEGQDYEQHANLEITGGSLAANVVLGAPDGDAEPGGWSDYSGPFDPGFQLEDLSHRALVIALQEVALQSHLLARAFLLSVGQRYGDGVAVEIGAQQWTGIAALTAERIRPTLGIVGDGIDAIAKTFQLHPCFHPSDYVDLAVEVTGRDRARIALGKCPAFEEGDPYSWFAGLGEAPHPALDAIAGTVDPHARCLPAAAPDGAHLAWDVVIDESAEPWTTPDPLKLGRLSKGASFQLERRRLPRP
ncbi:MAG: hypothetical protein ABFS41_05400 [Myxococcota bacterium]